MSPRLKRLPGIALALALKPLNALLSAVEGRVSRGGDEPLPHPPVFIIGAPRCGSTLLYQLLVGTTGFGYLSNFHCLFHGSPSLVHRLGRRFTARAADRYRSHYGRAKGLGAPAECGEFWYRFFRRRPQYVTAGEVGPAALARLRGAIRRLVVAMGRPLLIKNLLSSVRLRPLAEALPEALFIVLRRDEVDTAASLLEGRRRLYGTYERWFSVEPPEIDRLRRLPVAEQAVEQVRAIHRLIDRDRRAIGAERFIEVSYDALCADAHGTLRELDGFLRGHGVELGPYGDLPKRFKRRGGKTNARLLEEIERYAAGEADGSAPPREATGP